MNTINCSYEGCLKNLFISNQVTEIGQGAFCDWAGLTSIVILQFGDKILYEAFMGCTGVISITIPDSVTEIGEAAFVGRTGQTSIIRTKSSKHS